MASAHEHFSEQFEKWEKAWARGWQVFGRAGAAWAAVRFPSPFAPPVETPGDG